MKTTFSIKVEYESEAKVIRFIADGSVDPIANLDIAKDAGDDIDLERHVGYIIIAALSASSGYSIGGRDYKKERNDFVPDVLDNFRRRLKEGDESAILSMVHEYVASAVRNSDPSQMDAAEVLLQEAATAGNAQAAHYLGSTWLQDKRDILDSMQRK